MRRASWIGVLLILFSSGYFPQFPDSSLDSSWMQGMNAALGHGAVPGRDLVFTYGPLSALMTGYLGYAYAICLLLSLAIALNLAILMYATFDGAFVVSACLIFLFASKNETIFYLYVSVLPFAVVCHADGIPGDRKPVSGLLLLWSFGLLAALPIAKLAFLPGCLVLSLLSAIYLACMNRRRMAILLPMATAASAVAWWMISGQRIGALAGYLFDGEIIVGYTAAMEGDLGLAVAGINVQFLVTLFLYLLLAVLVWSMFALRVGRWTRLYLAIATAGTLALGVKAAVTRNDIPHLMSLWLVFAVVALYLLGRSWADPRARLVVAASVLPMVFVPALGGADGNGLARIGLGAKAFAAESGIDWKTGGKSLGFLTRYVVEHPRQLFDSLSSPLGGLSERFRDGRSLVQAAATSGESVRSARESSRKAIRKACDITQVEGTADIYPADINCLLAEDVSWDPRPVFQSYSAYTPELLARNAGHLMGSTAPEWIFFSIDPIDDRYPNLEDGYSWRCIVESYSPGDTRVSGRFLILRKTSSSPGCLEWKVHSRHRGILGVPNNLDCSDAPVFASVSMEPTVLGRLASTIYKQRRLVMDVQFCGGGERSFRFVPGMAALPFLLSPVLGSSAEFKQLFYQARTDLPGKVRSFMIRYADSESPVRGWRRDFEFDLYGPLPGRNSAL